MSALGQKQTFALQNVMSALPPIATAKADFPQTVVSALPPKADIPPVPAAAFHTTILHHFPSEIECRDLAKVL
jgi:hypothetical protein